MLYRVFPLMGGAEEREAGGPLHVPRIYQGAGRHDNPSRYGALYASREAVSAVAEWLRRWRGRELRPGDFLLADGARMALAEVDDTRLPPLVDLDDPAVLIERSLRPSQVATRIRRRTRTIALQVYEEGHPGISWWSSLEASWINVTIFAERAGARLATTADPVPLSVDHPAVVQAAAAVPVRLAGYSPKK